MTREECHLRHDRSFTDQHGRTKTPAREIVSGVQHWLATQVRWLPLQAMTGIYSMPTCVIAVKPDDAVRTYASAQSVAPSGLVYGKPTPSQYGEKLISFSL